MKKTWMGNTKCDFCGREIKDTLFDGQTDFGSWAVMCPTCHAIHGAGIANRYKFDGTEFVKVEKKPKRSRLRSAMLKVSLDLGLNPDEAEMQVDDYLGFCM